MSNGDRLDPARGETFCVLPWVHICGSVDGVWGRCCIDGSMYYGHYYKGHARPELRLSENAIGCSRRSAYAAYNPERTFELVGAFNGPAMKRTRLAMLAGERVTACDYCYRRETGGGRSYRQMANQAFSETVARERLIERTRADGALDAFPSYLDIRFGNVCNLACVMCEYPTSSRWGAAGATWSQAKIDPYSEDEELWEILVRNVTRLRKVYFAGGEPFLQPMHFKLLDLLLASGCAPQVTIAYSTNLTVLPPGLLEKLSRFKEVDIGASCDGLEDTFEAIRVGARWPVFVRNLREVRERFPVRLAVTPQKHNVDRLGEIAEWGLSEGCEVDLTNILLFPEELCVSRLDPVEKARWAAIYRSKSASFRGRGHAGIADGLDHLVEFLGSGEGKRSP